MVSLKALLSYSSFFNYLFMYRWVEKKKKRQRIKLLLPL